MKIINRSYLKFAWLLALPLILAACAPTSSSSTATSTAVVPGTGSTATPMAYATPMATVQSTPSATSPSQTAAAPATTPAASGVTVMAENNANLGKMILTDSQGMTLYEFTPDKPGTSTCYGSCAQIWPALTVASPSDVKAGSGVTATLGTTQRTDGTYQVTVNGMPVYHYYKDTKPGDTLGQGLLNKWYVVDPAGNMIK